MYYSTKKTGFKKQKKIFAEGLAWPSAKGVFAEGLANRPRQRIFKKKIFAECTEGRLFAEGSWGWPSTNRAFAECLRSSPRQTQKPSAKDGFLVVSTDFETVRFSNSTTKTL